MDAHSRPLISLPTGSGFEVIAVARAGQRSLANYVRIIREQAHAIWVHVFRGIPNEETLAISLSSAIGLAVNLSDLTRFDLIASAPTQNSLTAAKPRLTYHIENAYFADSCQIPISAYPHSLA